MKHRVQGGHGVLKDHGDAAAADFPQLLVRHLHDVLALKENLAADDLAGGIGHQAEDAQRGGGLAGAGLAHQAEGFAFADGEADVVDGADGAVMV